MNRPASPAGIPVLAPPLSAGKFAGTSRIGRWRNGLAPAGAAILTVAAVLRLCFRDHYGFTAPSFYALPLPLHIIGWLGVAGLWGRRKKWRALTAAGLAIVSAGWWHRQSADLRHPVAASSLAAAETGPRIFFWNLGHPREVPESLHSLLSRWQPDIAAFAESEKLGTAALEELHRRHPGCDFQQLPEGMICMARGRLTPRAFRDLRQRSAIHLLTASLDRFPGEWRICLTDIGPLPPLPRTDIIAEVLRTATGHARTIICGDFNTPLDAAAFDDWRPALRHGFADCPDWRGPLETWAFGLPVLTIDHIWLSPDLLPASAEKGSLLTRDHAWLVVDTAIRPDAPARSVSQRAAQSSQFVVNEGLRGL